MVEPVTVLRDMALEWRLWGAAGTASSESDSVDVDLGDPPLDDEETLS